MFLVKVIEDSLAGVPGETHYGQVDIPDSEEALAYVQDVFERNGFRVVNLCEYLEVRYHMTSRRALVFLIPVAGVEHMEFARLAHNLNGGGGQQFRAVARPTHTM